MKFIKLESRGGNYLVVAENVAWLRVAENGQTSVGIVGGQPLLVVGSLEEVAAKLLEAAAGEEAQEQQAPAPEIASAAAPAPEPQPAPSPVAEVAPQPAADAAPAPQPVVEPVSEAAPEPQPAPKPAPTIVNLSLKPAPSAGGTSLSERLAAARPKSQRVAAE